MKDLWQLQISDWRDNHGLDTIRWKTTFGIGDTMYGMNIAHMRAFVNQKPTTFELHFFHEKDYRYHYEDPETVYERFEYVRKRYMWPDIVNIKVVLVKIILFINSSIKVLHEDHVLNFIDIGHLIQL